MPSLTSRRASMLSTRRRWVSVPDRAFGQLFNECSEWREGGGMGVNYYCCLWFSRSSLSPWRWPLRTCRRRLKSSPLPQTRTLQTPRCCRWCCRAVWAPRSTRCLFRYVQLLMYTHNSGILIPSLMSLKVLVSVLSSDRHSLAHK